MTIPSANLTKTHMDASTDDPSQARAEIAAIVDKVNALITDIGAGSIVWTNSNDGAGSGLDADLLDGQQGSHYLDLANATGQLAGGQLGFTSSNCDKLDNEHGSFYQALANATGTLAFSQVGVSTNISAGSSVGANTHFQIGNILVNVGSVTVNKNATQSVTFSTAFTALVACIASPISAPQDFSAYANNLSNTGFDVTADASSGAASTTFHYIAVGWKT